MRQLNQVLFVLSVKLLTAEAPHSSSPFRVGKRVRRLHRNMHRERLSRCLEALGKLAGRKAGLVKPSSKSASGKRGSGHRGTLHFPATGDTPLGNKSVLQESNSREFTLLRRL